MSAYETVADKHVVTSFTPRVHVRHLAVDFWYYPGRQHNNRHDIGPLCGTGDENSEYMLSGPEHAHLPLCKRCIHRLNEYVENVAAEQVTP